MKNKWIIGIDEVGRGSLAGPVVVAAAACPAEKRNKLRGIRDSKKLSAKDREKWLDKIREAGIPYAVVKVGPEIVDRLNITRAANLAAWRAFRRLIADYKIPSGESRVFLDGGLYLKNKYWAAKNGIEAMTVIKGDEKIPAVSAASVAAKIARDAYMKKMAIRYPAYGFEFHVGYGTAVHMDAIRKFGPSRIHRKTFLNGAFRRNPV